VKVCGFGFAPGQTHRLKRPASMLAVVVGLLRAHRKQQAAAWLQWGALWRDLDLVVTDGRATPHNRDGYGGAAGGGRGAAGGTGGQPRTTATGTAGVLQGAWMEPGCGGWCSTH